VPKGAKSTHCRLSRIIAGNPVTTASMTSTVADAGYDAPVTILVAERPDGVHIAYTSASAIAPYQSRQRRRWRWTSIAKCCNCCVPPPGPTHDDALTVPRYRPWSGRVFRPSRQPQKG
jgi:hypothetical protein